MAASSTTCSTTRAADAPASLRQNSLPKPDLSGLQNNNRQIKDVIPKAWAAARRNTALSSLNIVNVVTESYDVYSPFESIDDCMALGVTLTLKPHSVHLAGVSLSQTTRPPKMVLPSATTVTETVRFFVAPHFGQRPAAWEAASSFCSSCSRLFFQKLPIRTSTI
jgi:hypothetical protein